MEIITSILNKKDALVVMPTGWEVALLSAPGADF